MTDSLYIAWRYVSYYWLRTLTVCAALTVIFYLPLALRLVTRAGQRELQARAEATPLLIGAKGSSLDLAINGLYFAHRVDEAIKYGQLERVADSGLATAIPLHTEFSARGFPVVGTSLDYFEFRGLLVHAGRLPVVLGDCVLGARVAEALGLAPGDHLVTTPENAFDLAGSYPLQMNIRGVLASSDGPDDLAVFVDVKTAWIIAGVGHGHQDLATVEDSDVILKREEKSIVANAKLTQFYRIDPDNIDSFHFHGDQDEFPLTAVVAVPPDARSRDLLLGRYLAADEPVQIIRPAEVMRELSATIFRLEGLFDVIIAVAGAATLLLLGLVTNLSLRLREDELRTMFRMGCGRFKTLEIVACELLLVVLSAAAAAYALTRATSPWLQELLKQAII